jgi:LysR family cys regulon transcriptional activator
MVLLPCYHWDRIVLVPKNHPLATEKGKPDIAALAEHPLVTYVFSLTGESSFKKAFSEKGLEPDVVFTARDADIIKTYVRMGMGVGVVAGMAYECPDEEDLVAISAEGLFPRCTTWLGYRRDSVLRGYMVDFIALFAPHLTPELTRQATALESQAEVDALFADTPLPIRGGCGNEIADAA